MPDQIATPYPDNTTIGSDLIARDGRLFFRSVDLAALLTEALPGQGKPLGSPLEVVFLPKITSQIANMRRWFAEASAAVGYPGAFHYAYASKANSAAEVTRTALAAGAHYETSSAADVDIVRFCLDRGLMPVERWTLNNGFKTPGSDYMDKIIGLRASGYEHVIPIIEDMDELEPLIASGHSFKVGLRQKIDKHARDRASLVSSDIRFGLDVDGLHTAARRIAQAPNLTLVMYHAMQGDVSADPDGWLAGMRASLGVYAELYREHPTLHAYNWGGGFPAAVGDLYTFDYPGFITRLLATAQAASAAEAMPTPDMVGEYGRYTTAEHGFHLFKVLKAKDNGSATPWYIIDGSIMSSFPDAWALGLAFDVLPLNHLDGPFQQVRLGGLTCDSDDIYPTRPEHKPLYLPVDAEELYIGVFGIGCYQEMLGGVRGVKHCLLPEAQELLIEAGDDGHLTYHVLPEQRYPEILQLLGYH